MMLEREDTLMADGLFEERTVRQGLVEYRFERKQLFIRRQLTYSLMEGSNAWQFRLGRFHFWPCCPVNSESNIDLLVAVLLDDNDLYLGIQIKVLHNSDLKQRKTNPPYLTCIIYLLS